VDSPLESKGQMMSASKIAVALVIVATAITVVCGCGGAAILLWNGLAEKDLVGIATPAIIAPFCALILMKSFRITYAVIGLLVVADWIAEIILIVHDCSQHPCVTSSHIGLALTALRLPFIKWLAIACACLACADWIRAKRKHPNVKHCRASLPCHRSVPN